LVWMVLYLVVGVAGNRNLISGPYLVLLPFVVLVSEAPLTNLLVAIPSRRR
jgi:hypothetical protein